MFAFYFILKKSFSKNKLLLIRHSGVNPHENYAWAGRQGKDHHPPIYCRRLSEAGPAITVPRLRRHVTSPRGGITKLDFSELQVDSVTPSVSVDSGRAPGRLSCPGQ